LCAGDQRHDLQCDNGRAAVLVTAARSDAASSCSATAKIKTHGARAAGGWRGAAPITRYGGMKNVEPGDDLNRQFAAERTHQDLQAHVEYGKALFQILIGSNGLAATALLTLAGAFKRVDMLMVVAAPTLCFLVGVCLGTKGLIELFRSKGGYGYAWQLNFYEALAEAKRQGKAAGKQNKRVFLWASLTAGAFAGGVVVAMLAFSYWFWRLGGFTQRPLLD
jgi:hypothetical protein